MCHYYYVITIHGINMENNVISCWQDFVQIYLKEMSFPYQNMHTISYIVIVIADMKIIIIKKNNENKMNRF